MIPEGLKKIRDWDAKCGDNELIFFGTTLDRRRLIEYVDELTLRLATLEGSSGRWGTNHYSIRRVPQHAVFGDVPKLSRALVARETPDASGIQTLPRSRLLDLRDLAGPISIYGKAH